MKRAPTVIHVYLVNEGANSWRPVRAAHLAKDLYEITEDEKGHPDEEWEFHKGEVVRCRKETGRDGSSFLVAYECVRGRSLAIDQDAVSATPGMPAFASKPSGAPVYHGFPILEGVEVEGFKFGMITNFLVEPDSVGDAFVVAPDGSRAGLVWEVTKEEYFNEVVPIEVHRWGVWAVSFPYPMDCLDNTKKNLAAALPKLHEKWAEWNRLYGSDK
jgi:hypothetical protein